MNHKPERSAARKASTSPDVFKSAGRGGFSGSAKGGRSWGTSEKRPFDVPRSPTRKDGKR